MADWTFGSSTTCLTNFHRKQRTESHGNQQEASARRASWSSLLTAIKLNPAQQILSWRRAPIYLRAVHGSTGHREENPRFQDANHRRSARPSPRLCLARHVMATTLHCGSSLRPLAHFTCMASSRSPTPGSKQPTAWLGAKVGAAPRNIRGKQACGGEPKRPEQSREGHLCWPEHLGDLACAVHGG